MCTLRSDIIIKLNRNDLLRLSRQILIDDDLIDFQLDAWLQSFECFRMAILGQLQKIIWYPNEAQFNGALSPHQMARLIRILDKHIDKIEYQY